MERLCSWPSWISARTRSHSRKGPERPLRSPDHGYDGETVSPSPQSNSQTFRTSWLNAMTCWNAAGGRPLDSLRDRVGVSEVVEQEYWEAARDLDERDRERIGIETRHQPSGSRVEHPGTDVRYNCRSPDHPESRMNKGDPG